VPFYRSFVSLRFDIVAIAKNEAFRATKLKVAITQWLHFHQKEGLCQEENITARI
jgi:hypothetical protein